MTRKKTLLLLLCLAAVMAGLSGCGQKGGLYLPEDPQQEQSR